MAWTATLRKPFTSPFSLTMATRCTSGTGYSRLLRYTKALGTQGVRGHSPGLRARVVHYERSENTQMKTSKKGKKATALDEVPGGRTV